MKHIQIKHYTYILLSLGLAIFSVYGVFTSLRTVHAESTPVAITHPTANQELIQGNQTIEGTGPALKEIAIYDGQQKIGTTTSLANGTWSVGWNNQVPGSHTLKASAITGSVYRADAYSQSSIQNYDANSGQLTQNYNTGFAGISGVVYEPDSNKAFVVGDTTVSVVNMTTRAVTDRINFNPTPMIGSSRSKSTYTFDQVHHRLYILGTTPGAVFNSSPYTTKLYTLNTQTGSLTSSINLDNVAALPLTLRIQSDPEGNFIYLYRPASINNGNSDELVTRVNLQSGTLDSSWNQRFSAGTVLPALNGDVYLVQDNVLRVYSASTDSLENLNIDASVCTSTVQAASYQSSIALSADHSTIYFSCANTSNSAKIVAYNTQTANVTTTFAAGNILTARQLLGGYLIIGSVSSNSLRVISTVDNTAKPAITGYSPFVNGNGSFDHAIERNSLTFNDNKMYFTTSDYLTRAELYTVNLDTGTITSRYDYTQSTGFPGSLQAYVSNGGIAQLTSASNSSLNVIDLQSGSLSIVKDGMGAASRVLFSKETNRLFSIDANLINLGTPGTQDSTISVANALTGQYENSIKLLAGDSPASGSFSADGSSLYVLAWNFGFESDNRIYKINTTTLAVEHIYTSLPSINQFTSPTILIDHNSLYFEADNKLYRLDLLSDTYKSVDTQGCYDYDCRTSGIAVDSSGSLLAVGTRIFNARTLELEQTITTPRYLQNIAFDSQNNLLVTGQSEYQAAPAQLFKYRLSDGALLSTINLASNLVGSNIPESCFTSDILPSSEGSTYMTVRLVCYKGSFGNSWRELISVIDPVNNVEISSKVLTGFTPPTNPFVTLQAPTQSIASDITVSSATQDVAIVGAQVAIVDPTDNQTLSAGAHTIVGASSPDTTVSVKIDGAVVGSAQSDRYGRWELAHTFSTAGSHQVRAEQQQIDQHIMYLSQNSLGPSTGHSVYAFNADSKQQLATITLPDDYIVGMHQLNKDKTKLYIVGSKDQTTKLYTVSTATNTIIATVTIENYVVSGDDFPYFLTSLDEQKIFLIETTTNHMQLLEFNSQTGARLQSIELPSNITKPILIPKAVLIHNGQDLLLIDNEQNNIVKVDLTTNTSEATPVPNGEQRVVAMTYDSVSDTLYTIFGDGSSGSCDRMRLIGASAQDGAVHLDTLLPASACSVLTTLLLSNDGSHLYVPVVDTDQTNAGIVDIQTQTGDLTFHSGVMPSNIVVSLTLGITASSDSTKFYLVNLSTQSQFLATSIFDTTTSEFSDTDGNIGAFTVDGDPVSSYSDRFSLVATGQTLSDQHTVQVQTPTVTTPTTPQAPIIKPVTPAIDNHPPLIPGSLAVTTAPTASKELNTQSPANKLALQKAKRALTYVSPFKRFTLGLKRILQRVPRPLINSLPYFLLLVLLALAAYYLYQTQKQLRAAKRLRMLFKKQEVLTEEKRNFLELTSHYLRTPLTYIKAGAEMTAKNKVGDQNAAELSLAVNHLGLFIESLVEEATAVQPHQVDGDLPKKDSSPFISKSFLLPLIGFGLMLGLFYFSFGFISGIHFSTATYITQILLGFLVVQIFYGMYKNHERVLDEKSHLNEILASEKALDYSRSKLMEDAGEQLQTRADHIAALIGEVDEKDTAETIIKQGIERLQELAKTFALVSKLETSITLEATDTTLIRDFAAGVIVTLKDEIQAKKLKLEVTGFDDDIMLTTSRPFAELTLKSLIENAVQASKEGSSLIIKCLHSEGRVAFQVIDHGEGIPKEKLAQLFKPFVRVGPVTTFNHEGIGLSLFIDRLVMHSLGGEVEIMSRFKQGTVATLLFKNQTLHRQLL